MYCVMCHMLHVTCHYNFISIICYHQGPLVCQPLLKPALISTIKKLKVNKDIMENPYFQDKYCKKKILKLCLVMNILYSGKVLPKHGIFKSVLAF